MSWVWAIRPVLIQLKYPNRSSGSIRGNAAPRVSAVSRRHARVLQGDGGLVVEDMGSRNTTLLGGEPVGDSARLKKGDVVQFGQVAVQLDVRDARPAAPQEGEEETPQAGVPAASVAAALEAPPGELTVSVSPELVLEDHLVATVVPDILLPCVAHFNRAATLQRKTYSDVHHGIDVNTGAKAPP